MTVSLPMVAIFGVIVWYLLRSGYLRLGSAIACALLGLYTGATPAGPAINHATHVIFAAFVGALAHLSMGANRAPHGRHPLRPRPRPRPAPSKPVRHDPRRPHLRLTREEPP